MSDLEIWIGPSKVFATGTIVLQSPTSVALYPFRPQTNYKIEINFPVSVDSAPMINWSLAPPETFILNIINFNNPLGVSTSAPIYVANHLKRKIMLEFATYLIGDPQSGRRVLHYTLFDGGDAP